MAHSEFKEAPPLHGWAIAIGAGALMFGVSLVPLDLGGIAAVAVGAVVALIVGVIFTLAESAPKGAAPAPRVAAPSVAPAVTSAVAAAPSAAAAAPETPAAEPARVAEDAPAPIAAAPAESAPVERAEVESADVEPLQPKGLDAPVGAADDLKRISGVGPVLEGKLNALGFYHFWQIAKWTRSEVDWVDGYLSFKGRIDRDNWISQAAKLAEDSPSKPPA
jgi:predicted flap endonuclease-1-like 5' DNA nuclease